MSNEIKCKDCPYFWQEDYENHGYCHYKWNDGCAPCEVSEPTELEPEEVYEYDEERW